MSGLMSSFTCYRLHDTFEGMAPADLDVFIEEEERPQIYGPQDMGDFVAKLYVSENAPHNPPWEGFIRSGFETIGEIPSLTSTGAAVVLALHPRKPAFRLHLRDLGPLLAEAGCLAAGLRPADCPELDIPT